MRLIEFGGYFINPDRVAYLKDGTSTHGGPKTTRIWFSGVSGDNVLVNGSVADVVHHLTLLPNSQQNE